ncbi:MAG TPA: hypothetical protein VIM12_03325 [Noviherbaspirillum sp.]
MEGRRQDFPAAIGQVKLAMHLVVGEEMPHQNLGQENSSALRRRYLWSALERTGVAQFIANLLDYPRRMPTAFFKAFLNQEPVLLWLERTRTTVATRIAENAGRNDVVSAVSSAITTCNEVLRRGLQLACFPDRQSKCGSKLVRSSQPSGRLTVKTAPALTFKSNRTCAAKRIGHEGLHK